MGTRAQTLTGASLKLYINEKLFGLASSFTFQTTGNRRPIHGIDQPNAFELAPAANDVNGSITCMRIRLDGGLEGRGIAANDINIAAEKYISIMLVDRISDTVIFRVNQAAIDNQSWSIDARGIMKGSFSFQGITSINDSDT